MGLPLLEQILSDVGELALVDQPEPLLELVDQPGHGLATGTDRVRDVGVGRPADDDPAVAHPLAVVSSEIEQMSLRRAPIPSYSPKSRAGRAFTALWSEIQREMLGESEFDSYQRIAV